MATVSVIKLIRTDTTLDLSQEAEKVWERVATSKNIYRFRKFWDFMVFKKLQLVKKRKGRKQTLFL